MGNKLARRRQVVEDRYTRPQGLYQHRDVDHKKLRKLILDSKLAPCFPGDDDDFFHDREECPICFLFYPSLNRSRCCAKGICTECFLQMKPPQATRPTQCPFCKTPNYAVEYRGAKTKEEKGKEQLEEQRFVEAKLRMQRQERLDEEERLRNKKNNQQFIPSMIAAVTTGEVEYQPLSATSTLVQGEASTTSHPSYSIQPAAALPRRPSYSRLNREEDIDSELEELMVREAIWLSIQDRDANRINSGPGVSPVPPFSEECYTSSTMVPAETPSRGLACAAQLAECQHIPDGSPSVSGVDVPFDMSPNSSCYPTGDLRLIGNYTPESCIEVSHSGGRALPMVRALPMEGQWIATPPVLPGVGTSYASSDIIPHTGTGMPFPVPPPDAFPLPSGHLVPETFEEQMMFAMAVSLAEARTRTNAQGLTWM